MAYADVTVMTGLQCLIVTVMLAGLLASRFDILGVASEISVNATAGYY